jgi:hypothetical protein
VLHRLFVIFRFEMIFRLYIFRRYKIVAYEEEPSLGNYENNGPTPSYNVDSVYFRKLQ